MSNVSIAFKNVLYIADQVFPIVPVAKKSDFYYTYSMADWFRDEIEVRAPGTRARRVDYTVSSASYNCLMYAAAKGVPDLLN